MPAEPVECQSPEAVPAAAGAFAATWLLLGVIRTRARLGGCSAAAAVFLLLTVTPGCVAYVVPTEVRSFRDDLGHKRIDANVMRSLRPGQTTLDDVLEDLGPPNVTLGEGRILVYTWATRQAFNFGWGLFAVNFKSGAHAANSGGFGFHPEQVHFLAMEFDRRGLLCRHRKRRDARLNMGAAGLDHVFE